MLKILRTIRRLNAIRRKAPHIAISQYGQSTPKPSVAVSVTSYGGSTTVDVYPDTKVGNAGATLRASSLQGILGLTVVDRRTDETNEATVDPLTRDWHRLPTVLAA